MSSQEANKTNNKPTHTIYFIKEKEELEKPLWIKVGVAWEHSDQKGLNLSLNNLGQEVGLTIRKNKPQQPKPE